MSRPVVRHLASVEARGFGESVSGARRSLRCGGHEDVGHLMVSVGDDTAAILFLTREGFYVPVGV